jgi:hypothetical protein
MAAILAGTVDFGTSGTGCQVIDRTTTFNSSQSIHAVARLKREVRAGETVTITISKGSTVLDQSETPMESATSCLSGTVAASVFPAGHIDLRYSSGAEVLAEGAFDITGP